MGSKPLSVRVRQPLRPPGPPATEHLKNILLAVAALVIPVIGYFYTDQEKNKETQSKYVELALTILRETPTLENRNLRKWAVEVVNAYSKVALNADTQESLIKDQILPAGPVTPTTVLQGNYTQGVDLSSYEQEPIKHLSDAGIRFTLLRSTMGLSKTDANYSSRRDEAKKNKIVYGAYHVFSFDLDPQKQADFYLTNSQLGPGDIAPIVEVDDFAASKLSSEDCRKALLIWLNAVETATKTTPIICTNEGTADELFDAQFSRYRLWICQYTDAPKVKLPKMWGDWFFWQYTGSGAVPGATIDTKLDLNRYNGSLDSLKQTLIH